MSVFSLAIPEPDARPGRLRNAVSRQRRSLLLALGATAALAACGKKGDLELPPSEAVLEPVPKGELPGDDIRDDPQGDVQ